jgi:hypothetical protein
MMPRGPKGEKRPETVMDWTDTTEAMDADAPAKKRGSYKKSD